MHLEKASQIAPPGLAEMLTELGDGENGYGGTAFGRGEATLDAFLRACCDGEDPTKVGPDFVPQTIFWMIDETDGRAVGMVRARHQLNERLLQCGGHVGYYVRRDARGRGHATAALRMAVDYLRSLGVSRVLVTVDKSNVASTRVVMANGGVSDGIGVDARSGEVLDRFWIGRPA